MMSAFGVFGGRPQKKSLDIRAVGQPSLVAGPVFKTGEGQRELSLASSIPVLYRQLPFHQKTTSLLQGLAAPEVVDSSTLSKTCPKFSRRRMASSRSASDTML